MTPKDEALIREIVSASNSLFFQKMSRLLGYPNPVTAEEKMRLIRKIKGRFESVRK